MPYDFAKPGPVLHGYTIDSDLGFQQIRPLLLDSLSEKLKDYDMSWEYVKFIEANQEQVPQQPGVYFFIVHPRAANIEHHYIILYFGKARNLRTRFKDYLKERYGARDVDREHVKRMLMIYKNRINFAYVCLGRYEIEKVEDMLIEAFKPCCNRTSSRTVPAF